MPEVRYGPDVTDDAAQLLKDIVRYQDFAELINRRRKAGQAIDAADTKKLAELQKRATEASRLAEQLFGVSKKDQAARKFGLLEELAQYSRNGITTKTRRRGGPDGTYEYQRTKRYKPAVKKKGPNKGQRRRRSVAKEHELRGEGNPGRGYTDDRSGGASYLGGTVSKRLAGLLQRQENVSRGKTVTVGGKSVKIQPGRNKASLDKANIAREELSGRRDTGEGIRPPQIVAAAAKRAQKQQSATKSAVKKAGQVKKSTAPKRAPSAKKAAPAKAAKKKR